MRIVRNHGVIRWAVWVAGATVLAGCASAPPPASPRDAAPSAAQVQIAPKRPPRIGLALGGGAARGFAHVGVIQVLEEHGFKPELVAGTSAGSLVAAIYASGKSPAQLQQISEAMDEATFADWTLPIFNRGMLRGEAVARYVNGQVGGKTIDQLPIRLGITATDLQSGQAVLFRQGDTGTAVRASSAVPGVFLPVRIGNHEYVDGGLVAPVPVRQARAMGAELVIAVDISSDPEGGRTGDVFQVLLQTFAIMGKTINSYGLSEADVVVRPVLTGVAGSDFGARRRSIDAGRAAMQQMLPGLKAKFAELQR
jgi:NTE family protein